MVGIAAVRKPMNDTVVCNESKLSNGSMHKSNKQNCEALPGSENIV